MDADALKDVGIATIGQRLAILKAVYQVKVAQQVPIEADHYVPPCEASSPSNCTTNLFSRSRGRRTTRAAKRRPDVRFIAGTRFGGTTVTIDSCAHHPYTGERLRALEEDNRRLSESLHSCLEDITSIRSSAAPRPVSLMCGFALTRSHWHTSLRQRALFQEYPHSNGHRSSSHRALQQSRPQRPSSRARRHHLSAQSTISTPATLEATALLRHLTEGTSSP